MGLFDIFGIFGKKSAPAPAPAPATPPAQSNVPDASGKLPAGTLHPKFVGGAIAGLVPVGIALVAVLTGNVSGTPREVIVAVLPFVLTLVGVYIAKSPPSPLLADVGQVVEGMQEGLSKPQ